MRSTADAVTLVLVWSGDHSAHGPRQDAARDLGNPLGGKSKLGKEFRCRRGGAEAIHCDDRSVAPGPSIPAEAHAGLDRDTGAHRRGEYRFAVRGILVAEELETRRRDDPGRRPRRFEELRRGDRKVHLRTCCDEDRRRQQRPMGRDELPAVEVVGDHLAAVVNMPEEKDVSLANHLLILDSITDYGILNKDELYSLKKQRLNRVRAGVHHLDLRDHKLVSNFFGSFSVNCDAVIHLAALVRVNESVNEAAWYYENNIVGTLNLLKYLNFKPATAAQPEYWLALDPKSTI